jgi:uncharacterized protein (DUF736 family)
MIEMVINVNRKVKIVPVWDIFSNKPVFVIKFGSEAVGAAAESRYGFGSTKMMLLFAAPAPPPQHWCTAV